MRIGLFGGTFDPVHHGHLILAERVRGDAGLDEVRFLPSYQPPHKAEQKLTRFDHRCEMVSLAMSGQPAFRLETIERELPPPSYTVNTVKELKSRQPGDEFYLVVGADCLPDLPKWHQPRELLKLAGLLAVPRPGTELWSREQLAAALDMPVNEVNLQIVECPLITISSREIRSRVAERKSIRYLVPRAVEEYLREKKLYQ